MRKLYKRIVHNNRFMDALFSIKTCYAERIFDGTKRYEFRKTCCREKLEKIYIYVTAPVCAVLGECVIETVLEGPPVSLWKNVSHYAGISEKEYSEYFRGHKRAIAYKLSNVVCYEKPKKLASFGVNAPPQSFQYIHKTEK